MLFLDPSGYPSNVRTEVKSSSSVLVMWGAVPEDQRNGVIVGYKVIRANLADVQDNRALHVIYRLYLSSLKARERNFNKLNTNLVRFEKMLFFM